MVLTVVCIMLVGLGLLAYVNKRRKRKGYNYFGITKQDVQKAYSNYFRYALADGTIHSSLDELKQHIDKSGGLIKENKELKETLDKLKGEWVKVGNPSFDPSKSEHGTVYSSIYCGFMPPISGHVPVVGYADIYPEFKRDDKVELYYHKCNVAWPAMYWDSLKKAYDNGLHVTGYTILETDQEMACPYEVKLIFNNGTMMPAYLNNLRDQIGSRFISLTDGHGAEVDIMDSQDSGLTIKVKFI